MAYQSDARVWALRGLSCPATGIGKSIAARLAKQGLNVVLVALGDDLLDSTFDEFNRTYPSCQFRKVPLRSPRCTSRGCLDASTTGVTPSPPQTLVRRPHEHDVSIDNYETQFLFLTACIAQVPADLGGSDYLEPIATATSDIKVQIVFCNAGYLLTGFFHTR
jgi:NAD(P)-dependent dehydrogenase (short-subunit alcohol dehydrogenase family)